MKALTIWEPWASLIVDGIKDVENRSWKTNHRGVILIHAGKSVDWSVIDQTASTSSYTIVRVRGDTYRIGPIWPGHIIGQVAITDCCRSIKSHDWHESGSFGFYLAKPKRFFSPIPWKGSQRLFDVPDNEIA